MAGNYNDQNSLLQNPSNDPDPMAEMRDDEALEQDYETPFAQGEGDEESEEETEALKHYPQSDTNVDSHESYNEALVDALEIRPVTHAEDRIS